MGEGKLISLKWEMRQVYNEWAEPYKVTISYQRQKPRLDAPLRDTKWIHRFSQFEKGKCPPCPLCGTVDYGKCEAWRTLEDLLTHHQTWSWKCPKLETRPRERLLLFGVGEDSWNAMQRAGELFSDLGANIKLLGRTEFTLVGNGKISSLI